VGTDQDEHHDTLTYEVVRNIHGQYSVLLQGDPPPAGWELVGYSGGRDDCLARIEEIWTDMTPVHLRDRSDG
jgi:MbtH protein